MRSDIAESILMKKRISDCLDNHPEGVTAAEISEMTMIPEKQVRNILNKRRNDGEVEAFYRNAPRRYRRWVSDTGSARSWRSSTEGAL